MVHVKRGAGVVLTVNRAVANAAVHIMKRTSTLSAEDFAAFAGSDEEAEVRVSLGTSAYPSSSPRSLLWARRGFAQRVSTYPPQDYANRAYHVPCGHVSHRLMRRILPSVRSG